MPSALPAASVSARIAEVLAHHVTDVFGLMGNGNAHLVDAFARTRVRYTAVRHEVATVASADAYYRVSRRPAVATTTYGAGYTNAMTSLADARMSGSALVLVVGDAPTTGLRPWDVDQAAMAAAMGVKTFTVDAERPGAIALEALRHAVVERTPVVLAIPYDLPAAPAGEESLDLDEAIVPVPVVPESRALDQVAQLLAKAERPVILAGRGARHAIDELSRLADELGAITASTAPARGGFAHRTLDVGVSGGFSSERAIELLGQADVVLAVGAGLNQFTMGFGRLYPEGAEFVQIDELEGPTHPQVTRYVRGDAELAARELLDRVQRATERAAQTWAGVDPEYVKGAQKDRHPGEQAAKDGRLDPRSVMVALDRMLPADRLVVTDGGHFIGWPNTYLDLPKPDSIVMVGTAYQSIGLGFSSAPGATVADPDRTLVLVSGDGGGLMAIADLDSTVRAAKRAVIVVVNDMAYNAEITQYGTIGLDKGAMLIDEVDFATFAKAVGAEGLVIRELAELDQLETWLAEHETGTLLLDCRVSMDVVAPYQAEIMGNLRRALGIDEGELEALQDGDAEPEASAEAEPDHAVAPN